MLAILYGRGQDIYGMLPEKSIKTDTSTNLPDTICTGFQSVSKRWHKKAYFPLRKDRIGMPVLPAKLPKTEKTEKILEIQNIPCYNGICIWIT